MMRSSTTDIHTDYDDNDIIKDEDNENDNDDSKDTINCQEQ